MRLVVCSTREQQQHLQRLLAGDHVVVFGTIVNGLRVTEIVDKTFLPRHNHPHEYWDHIACQVRPTT